ncbi:hypothetical protein RCL1_008242 [Eukaryota sp. TZLM3-RCL]
MLVFVHVDLVLFLHRSSYHLVITADNAEFFHDVVLALLSCEDHFESSRTERNRFALFFVLRQQKTSSCTCFHSFNPNYLDVPRQLAISIYRQNEVYVGQSKVTISSFYKRQHEFLFRPSQEVVLFPVQTKVHDNQRESSASFSTDSSASSPEQADPIVFICNFPDQVYSKFGNQTKFIRETMGTALDLSNNDCQVKSSQFGSINSFIAINHPQNGQITLTITDTRSGGFMGSYIGYFDPRKCQDEYSFHHFTGINPHCNMLGSGIHCVDRGKRVSKVTLDLYEMTYIFISFNNDQVTFSTPRTGWSNTIERVSGWVFGVSVYWKDEAWSVE